MNVRDADDVLAIVPPEQQKLVARLLQRDNSEKAPSSVNADFLRGLLNGTLPPKLPDPMDTEVCFMDADLDGGQREAVRRAMNSPDICLLMGGPGTGKSRVLTEMIRQATARGERVLLIAATTAAIDVVLERLDSQQVMALRCLGSGEQAEALAPEVRQFTSAAWLQRLGHDLVEQANELLNAQEKRVAELESLRPNSDRLAELVSNRERSPRTASIAAEIAAMRADEQRLDADRQRSAAAIAALQQEISRSDSLFSRLMFWRTRNVPELQGRMKDLELAQARSETERAQLQSRLALLESERQLLAESVDRDQRAAINLDQECETLAKLRRWRAFLDQHVAELQATWHQAIDLAATTVNGECPELLYDLLILDDAHQLAASDLARWARKARRWVLCGETQAHAGIWPRLWQILHFDVWRREKGAWRCRWQPLSPSQLRELHSEKVADRSDIELRIRANGGSDTDLVEIMFPQGLSLAKACRFLLDELQEIPVPEGPPVWRQCAGDWHCFWSERTASNSVDLGEGVIGLFEETADRAQTVGLRFVAGSGWTRERAESWLREYGRCVDPGRTARI